MTGLKPDRWIVRVSLVYHRRVFTIISAIVLFTARCRVLRHQETKQLLHQYRSYVGFHKHGRRLQDGARILASYFIRVIWIPYSF